MPTHLFAVCNHCQASRLQAGLLKLNTVCWESVVAAQCSLEGPACRVSGLDEEAFGALHNTIRRGDLVGVKGLPGKSKRGELSVFPTSFAVLAPCLHMLPKYRLDNQVSIFNKCLS